jgi:hypothetical protein
VSQQRRRESPDAGGGREYIDPNGVVWTFTQRPQVREGEEQTHVALMIESPWESRVVSCPRAEWETAQPDYARLLGGSVPVGGSRGRDRTGPPGDEVDTPEF